MGALRLGHEQQVADDSGAVTVRLFRESHTGQAFTGRVFRLLSQPERARRAAAFETVCERHGAIARIARTWAVSPSMVARVRDGLSPLTDERVRKLPQAQREHLFQVLDANAQLSLF